MGYPPNICVYENDVRVFAECQTLQRPDYMVEIPVAEIGVTEVDQIPPATLWSQLRSERRPLVIDLREPQEFRSGHVPGAELVPLPEVLRNPESLPADRPIVFVCLSGWRSRWAAQKLCAHGRKDVQVLSGGMFNWQSEGLLCAVDAGRGERVGDPTDE